MALVPVSTGAAAASAGVVTASSVDVAVAPTENAMRVESGFEKKKFLVDMVDTAALGPVAFVQ